MTNIDPKAVLDLKMLENTAKAETVREYLLELLDLLWAEGDDFPAKRPFGNSNWQYDIYRVLIKANLISATIDEDGYVADADFRTADKLIHNAIMSLY